MAGSDRVSLPVCGTEVRIKTGGKIRDYVAYAMDRLQPAATSTSHVSPVVTFTATGRAVPKAIAVAEIVKRQIGGLHQVVTLDSLPGFDGKAPGKRTGEGSEGRTVEGSSIVSRGEQAENRRITVIGVALAKDAGNLDVTSAGYQAPVESENGGSVQRTKRKQLKKLEFKESDGGTTPTTQRRRTRRGKGDGVRGARV